MGVLKRFFVGLVSLGLIASTLAACSESVGLVKGSSLVIGQGSYISNLNASVVGTTGQIRSNTDLAALTMPSFYSEDQDGNPVANTGFGSVMAKGNQVTYRLTGSANWSDGVPVSEADLALAWAAATNEAGGGFNSTTKATSLSLAQTVPAISKNSLVVTYETLPPDWQTNLKITVPAHLIANQVYTEASSSGNDAVQSLIQAITSANEPELALIAEQFNQAMAVNTSAPTSSVDKKLLVTAGPYLLQNVSAQEASLVVNPDFTWGQPATVEKLTFKCFNGTKRLLASLNRGELDLAMPVETITTGYAQILTSLDAASELGISYLAGVSPTQEVMLFSYRSRSAFAYNLSKSNAQLVESAREAFRIYTPRSSFVTTLSPGSALTRSDSLLFAPGTSEYKSSIKSNGTADIQFQQAEQASELLVKAGHTEKVPIRVLFDSKNPRGQIEFGILDRYSKASGFVLQNISSVNPAQTFVDGTWDVYITNQQLLGSSKSALAAALGIGTGFKNEKATALVSALRQSKDLTKETAKLEELDKLLIENGFALPLFALPNSIAYSEKLEKFTPNLATQSLVSGYWNWSVQAPAK